MTEPGETKKAVGAVASVNDLEMMLLKNRANAHPLTKLRTETGDKYTLAYLTDCGIALYSHQNASVYVLHFAEIAMLAKGAGLDKETPLIILPGSEVRRG
jgi:hypothetical protein